MLIKIKLKDKSTEIKMTNENKNVTKRLLTKTSSDLKQQVHEKVGKVTLVPKDKADSKSKTSRGQITLQLSFNSIQMNQMKSRNESKGGWQR